MSKKQTELRHLTRHPSYDAGTVTGRSPLTSFCKRRNAYHPTKMALHGSLLLEDPGIFSHAGDELIIAYRLIQPEVMVPTFSTAIATWLPTRVRNSRSRGEKGTGANRARLNSPSVRFRLISGI